ncbi:YitT family protein [Enterococcus nangangensis]
MQVVKNLIHEKDAARKLLVILFTAITCALGMNMFLIPANIMSAGASGLAQIIASLLHSTVNLSLDTGFLILLLNVPVAILGLYKLGLAATFLTFLNVVASSLAIMIMPTYQVTNNPLMSAIVGGVLVGVGAGFSLKYGFTTGGLDIVSLVLSKTTGKTVGNLLLFTNGLIVLVAGFIFSWESALYTIICIYAMITVVDAIHTSHQKLTAMIVTTQADVVTAKISEKMLRGMTLFPTYGGYSKEESRTIMMVVTRYELYDLETAVSEVDPNAFMDILPTKNVVGRFANEEEQKYYRTTGTWPEAKLKKS